MYAYRCGLSETETPAERGNGRGRGRGRGRGGGSLRLASSVLRPTNS